MLRVPRDIASPPLLLTMSTLASYSMRLFRHVDMIVFRCLHQDGAALVPSISTLATIRSFQGAEASQGQVARLCEVHTLHDDSV